MCESQTAGRGEPKEEARSASGESRVSSGGGECRRTGRGEPPSGLDLVGDPRDDLGSVLDLGRNVDDICESDGEGTERCELGV